MWICLVPGPSQKGYAWSQVPSRGWIHLVQSLFSGLVCLEGRPQKIQPLVLTSSGGHQTGGTHPIGILSSLISIYIINHTSWLEINTPEMYSQKAYEVENYAPLYQLRKSCFVIVTFLHY